MGMQKLVSLDDIELNVSAADWQDAVEKSGTILVNNGYVTREYVDAMIQTVKTLGPYIVVAPTGHAPCKEYQRRHKKRHQYHDIIPARNLWQ